MSKIKYNDYVEFANALENVFTQVTGDFTSPVVSYIYDAVELINKATPGFLEGYCAVSVHDAYEGGLPAHTVKVFSQLCSFMFGGIVLMYSTITSEMVLTCLLSLLVVSFMTLVRHLNT